jgi:hypothetical protein
MTATLTAKQQREQQRCSLAVSPGAVLFVGLPEHLGHALSGFAGDFRSYVAGGVHPPGWRNDVLRHEAVWTDLLLPGHSATWQMGPRREYKEQHKRLEQGSIPMRAECQPWDVEQPWLVPVEASLTTGAKQTIGDALMSG